MQEQDDRTTPSRERTPLFGLWSTAAIALALVVPFAFATLTGSEPYPAVIFPGGGSISTHLDGQDARFEVDSLVGFTDDGTPRRLDPTEFLDPIPPSYAGGLVGTLFGQDVAPTTRLEVAKLGGTIEVERHVPSAEERAEARAWLAGRLEAAGVRPDRLEVHYDRVTVDHTTGEVLDRTTVEEVVILG